VAIADWSKMPWGAVTAGEAVAAGAREQAAKGGSERRREEAAANGRWSGEPFFRQN